MSEKLVFLLEKMELNESTEAYFYNNLVNLTKIGIGKVKMIVPKGGSEIYGPGAGVESRFVNPPVLPILDFSTQACQTVKENGAKPWEREW